MSPQFLVSSIQNLVDLHALRHYKSGCNWLMRLVSGDPDMAAIIMVIAVMSQQRISQTTSNFSTVHANMAICVSHCDIRVQRLTTFT